MPSPYALATPFAIGPHPADAFCPSRTNKALAPELDGFEDEHATFDRGSGRRICANVFGWKDPALDAATA